MRHFGYGQNYSWFTVGLAESHLLNGDVQKAREMALHGLKAAELVGFPLGLGLAHRALGRIALRTGDFSQAEPHFAQALSTLSSIPARLELARTHIDVAALANLQQDADLARAHYIDAVRMFTELNLKRHAEHTKELAAQSGVTLAEQSEGSKTGGKQVSRGR